MTPSSQPALQLAFTPTQSQGTETIQHPALGQPALQQPALTLFAIGLIGLGVVALVFGDFAMVWQPVAPWFPGRTALAYVTGALEMCVGFGLLFSATRAWAVRILFPGLILWALLKVPAVVVAPLTEGVWLGLAELTILLSGGWTLFARLAELPEGSIFGFAAGERGVHAARMLFGASLPPIGLSHFVYLQATVHLVPAWLPFRAGWARLTGAGQIASGLGVLFNVLPRAAAWAQAAQISIYTLLIWLPASLVTSYMNLQAVFGQSGKRLPFTALFISWTIASAAWVVAQNVPQKRVADAKK
ncbi:MAG: DoxX family protein [Terracidiphilus sp.]